MASAISLRLCTNIGCRSLFQNVYRTSNFFVRDLSSAKKPTKPGSAFLVYYSEVRPELVTKFPGKNSGQLSAIAGQMYRTLDEQKKQQLKDSASLSLERYKQEMQAWKDNMSVEELEAEKQQRSQMRKEKQKRKLNRLKKENSRPKKPLAGFLLFYQNQLQNKNIQFLPLGEKMKAVRNACVECGEQWNNMTAQQKEAFSNKEELAEYEKNLLEWEKQMFVKGLYNVIRKPTLALLQKHDYVEGDKLSKSVKKKTKTKTAAKPAKTAAKPAKTVAKTSKTAAKPSKKAAQYSKNPFDLDTDSD